MWNYSQPCENTVNPVKPASDNYKLAIAWIVKPCKPIDPMKLPNPVKNNNKKKKLNPVKIHNKQLSVSKP